MITIRPVEPTERGVGDLIAFHLSGMVSNSPRESVFALDASGLSAPNISLFAAFEDDTCLSIGALKKLTATLGEIKSMRTADVALGRGIGTLVLEHIMDKARKNGMKTLVLETGTGVGFEAAHHLYKKYGFLPAAAFGSYKQTEFNRFFSLTL